MFTYTPLLGAQSGSRASQSILELDGGVKILVDVGWDERFDTGQLAAIEKNASSLSFILLTHATVSHLGAFAHCCKHVPYFAQIPIYATSPVIAFGRTLLQDLYSSTPLAATFIPPSASPEDGTTDDSRRTSILRQAPTNEEINKYFSLITPLKYSQPLQPTASQFSASLEGLTLTAYNSGHTLGGTIWHIMHGMESIVYAVDWSQARENVIAGAAWFGGVGGAEVIEQLRKPTALVCSSVGGDKIALAGGRKAKDEALLGHIKSTLARGGSVLIPTDSSARVLELAWLLEKSWQEGASDAPLKGSRVYMASKSASATLRHARSLLEWMDESIVREFDGEEEAAAAAARPPKYAGGKQINGVVKPSRPFEFRHVKLIERQAQLERALKMESPRVILASDLSLDWGYAAPILERFSQSSANLILLTEKPGMTCTPSPSQQLWKFIDERQHGVALESTASSSQIEQVHGGARVLSVSVYDKAPLNEQENQQYQQYVAAQRQLQSSLIDTQAAVEAEDNMDNDSSSSSSEESDNEQQGRALNVSVALGHTARNKIMLTDEDLGVNILVRKKDAFDFDVRNKKGRNAVFPYTHSRRRGDEFGDLIKPEEFLREEEKEEQFQVDAKADKHLGQKRKWAEERQLASNSNKRRQVDRAEKTPAQPSAGEADESDVSDGEPEAEPATFQGPARLVTSTRSFALNARLAFVDFAGLHDQRSLQMLIPLIGPKKLVLTGGTAEETQALASDCKELLGVNPHADDDRSAEIFTPANGQVIDASVDTNAWVVKLSRNLARTLRWQHVKSIGVFTVSGQLKADDPDSTEHSEDGQVKKQKMDTELDTELDTESRARAPPQRDTRTPILDVLPPALAASTRSVAQPIHVGDTRLADLRRLLNASGHSAEFRGEGTILVDGLVAVRKMANGRIVVEGVPLNVLPGSRSSDSFTHVKQRIYAGLAVVAAG
ncbi:hypothetical protein DV737_g2884, partial [Chaetothyriales sp. CBS 132003]